MKKTKYLIIIVLIMFIAFTMSACDIFSSILCSHEFEESDVAPTCTERGYHLETCIKCGYNKKTNYVGALGHSFSEFVTIKEATEEEDGIMEATCTVCGAKVEKIIKFKNYIDLDIIKYPYIDKYQYTVRSLEEASKLFNCALLYGSDTLSFDVNFDVDFDELMNYIKDNISVTFSYQMEANGTALGNKLKSVDLTLNVSQSPKRKSENVLYTQYNSLNLSDFTPLRREDFDNFKINSSSLSYRCVTSEQLYYTLSRAVKPNCVSGSDAERIYNKAKEVLRQIINDDMTDYEKIKAIHDYIVMNVTYDGALYNMVGENGGAGLSDYAGFYLEGVFDNHLAVCEGISKAVCVLANIEGIACVFVNGYQVKNPNGVGHAWNKVRINDTWYILDCTSDGVIINNQYETLSYEYFLVDTEKMEKYCKGKVFEELECNSNYNYFKNFNFIYDNHKYDYYIESYEELVKLISYFETSSQSSRTIQCYMAYKFDGNVSSEIRKVYNQLHKNVSFAYSYNEPLLTVTVDN